MGTMGTHAGALSQMRCLRTRAGSGFQQTCHYAWVSGLGLDY